MEIVRTRLSRREVKNAILNIAVFSHTYSDLVEKAIEESGNILLGILKRAFLEKAKGGTDEAGLRWEPLAPSTIAKRLRYKTREGYRPSAGIDARERERWWDYYRRGLAMFSGSKSAAAKYAWGRLKREGVQVKTKSGPVDILKDTGALYNSIEVSIHSRGEIEIKSSIPYSGFQHRGNPSTNCPARPLWAPPADWPSKWWVATIKPLAQGLAEATARAF